MSEFGEQPIVLRIARGFLRILARGQTKAAFALIAPRIRAESDPDQLAATWQSWEEQWGEYRGMAPFALGKDGELDVVSWVVEFERQLVHVDVRVALGEGVVGWRENPPPPAPLTPTGVPVGPHRPGQATADPEAWDGRDPGRVVAPLSRAAVKGGRERGRG